MSDSLQGTAKQRAGLTEMYERTMDALRFPLPTSEFCVSAWMMFDTTVPQSSSTPLLAFTSLACITYYVIISNPAHELGKG